MTWGRDKEGLPRQFYFPAHLVAFIPIIIVSGGDFVRASEIFFDLSVAATLLLATLLAHRLARGAEQRVLVASMLAVLLIGWPRHSSPLSGGRATSSARSLRGPACSRS